MIDDLLLELIELVKKAAPELWEIYIRQIYIDGAGKIAYGAVFLVAAIVCIIVLRKTIVLRKKIGEYNRSPELYRLEDDFKELYAKDADDGDITFALIVSSLVGALAVWMTVDLFVSAAKYFFNPSYYAIQLLIESVK